MGMLRVRTWGGTLAVAVAAWLGGEAAGLAGTPNLILIVADDLGAHDLGCDGSTFHRTPNLDAMARRGLRFSQAYAAAPVCSPTRVALLTGQTPARSGLTEWLPGRPDSPDHPLLRPELPLQLPLEATTLAEVLKAKGYATWHVGKWHLGGAGFGPEAQGFDVNIAGDETGTPRSYFAPFRDARGHAMPGLEQAPDGQSLTTRLGDEAVKRIEGSGDRPFFLYLPHYAVHTPLKAKAERIATYNPAGRPAGQQRNPVYAAMLEDLDDAVGRVIRAVEARGLADSTWIVFTSDNGGLATIEGGLGAPATINAPCREGKGWLYEGGLRVPLLIQGPGVQAPGTTIDTPVTSADLPATLASLAGAGRDLPALDGVDLMPLITGSGPIGRTALFWHFPHYANQGSRPGGAIRQGDFKLVELYENGRRELYDVAHDPGEARNLALDQPERVERLARRLALWRDTVGARMPTPNPDFVPNPQAADGTITLPARTAVVEGVQLRFEPLPHKNTLGFWVREQDTAAWTFSVTTPGTFELTGLIGCGTGQGGSQVAFVVDDQEPLLLTVPDTGGFQAFRPIVLGRVTLATAGRHRLQVRPVRKAKDAIMDIRQATLTPVARPD